MEEVLWDSCCLPAGGFLGSCCRNAEPESPGSVSVTTAGCVPGTGRVKCVCPTGTRASKCLASVGDRCLSGGDTRDRSSPCLPGSGGAQHPPQRSGPGLQGDVPRSATGLVTLQLLLLLEHPKGGAPRAKGAPLPPAAEQLPALPCQRCTEVPKDWKHRGKASMSQSLGDSSGLSPGANPSLRVPAEGTSPAPARVTKAGGIVPVQPRLSIPSVGAGGHPALG